MKRILSLTAALALMLTGCYTVKPVEGLPQDTPAPAPAAAETRILLSDQGSTVDGEAISGDSTQAVYAANDIVYYEEGRDFTYGEGSAADEHSPEEAAEHTVIHITRPGTYRISGDLTPGQIAVDLGEEAEDDPEAVVTLILDGVSIESTVAPAIIFYNVYECGDKDEATMEVDTSGAGANIIIAGNSMEGSYKLNSIKGSYVARIYESCTLSVDGTEVVDSEKLHKYDGAIYSRMSMNVSAEEGAGESVLSIHAENEGLDSELHLTINSGDIRISSGNDGINTNEDGVSVTTVNGGDISIRVRGETGEGDGIDSNGRIVINGGSVRTMACSHSGDSGLDADLGVHINGGSVLSTGNMPDTVAEGQTYALFSFAQPQTNALYSLKNQEGETVFEAETANGFAHMLISSPELVPGVYTLWCGDTQLGVLPSEGGHGGFVGMGGPPPEGSEPPEDGMVIIPGDGSHPEPPDDGFNRIPPEHSDGFGGIAPPEGFEDGMALPEGGGGRPNVGTAESFVPGELKGEFEIKEGANFFSFVSPLPLN